MTPFQRPEYRAEVEKGCGALEADIASGKIQDVIERHESSLGEATFLTAHS